jgi:hypothetical protein
MADKVISFYDNVITKYQDGKVTLDKLVRVEMLRLGYDPNNTDDIKTYWEDKLPDDGPPPDVA